MSFLNSEKTQNMSYCGFRPEVITAALALWTAAQGKKRADIDGGKRLN
jgi:hypothetical protein